MPGDTAHFMPSGWLCCSEQTATFNCWPTLARGSWALLMNLCSRPENARKCSIYSLLKKKKQPKTQNSHTERNQAAFFHPLFSPCPVTLLRASCNTSLAQLAERAAGQAKQSDCYPSRAATILHSFFFLFLFPLTFFLLCYCPLLKAGTGFYYLSLCLLSPSLTSFQEFKWTFTNAELCSEGCLKGHCQLTASVYVLKSLLA